MTDEEIIRRGVELADGWRLLSRGQIETPVFNAIAILINMDQLFLDALAAQLTRQVDALDNGFFIDITKHGADLYFGDALSEELVAGIAGPDRTMNTLRAIVESGVLEPK